MSPRTIGVLVRAEPVTEIPPMTHELGRYWDQPPREAITVDDKYAMMREATLKQLGEYSCSLPSGTYAGKMWRFCNDAGVNFLRWYEDIPGEPDELYIKTREILLV